jgi:cobalt transporter subunit CbtA
MMETFRGIFFAAVLAGVLAGVFVAVVHAFGTVPIILKAETFEGIDYGAAHGAPDAAVAAAPPAAVAHEHGDGHGNRHEHDADAWQPADGLERTAFTLLADILTGIGFALLLVSAYALRGGNVDWRRGLYWGLAGFATFTLAPGLGLPPELPGTEAAPLFARQIWWVATVAATGSGLALVFLTRKPIWILAGLGLILVPHLVGAPQPAAYLSLAPEALTREFMVTAILSSLLFWLGLGFLTGFFYERFAHRT